MYLTTKLQARTRSEWLGLKKSNNQQTRGSKLLLAYNKRIS